MLMDLDDVTLELRTREQVHVVAFEGPQLDLRQHPFPAHPVQDLQVLGPAGGRPLEPPHEGVRLVAIAQGEQGVELERGVAEPRVPVVPVPRAPNLLRQRGGGGRDDGARGRVGQRLQDEGAAEHRLPVWTPVGTALRPVPPEADRGLDPARHLPGVEARHPELVRQGVGEDGERLLAGAQLGLRAAPAEIGLHDREPGLEDQCVGAAVDHPDVASLQRQPGIREPVVEARIELDRELDDTFLAPCEPDELVVGMHRLGDRRIRRGSNGEAVEEREDPAIGDEPRLQDVRPVQVSPAHRGGPLGGDPEVASLPPVEQPREDGTRVEPVEAAPVDRTVR
jgi:hypothetical protein